MGNRDTHSMRVQVRKTFENKYTNVHTADDAEGEVDVKKSGSERRQHETNTQEKSSGHCYRTTTKPITQFTSYWSYEIKQTSTIAVVIDIILGILRVSANFLS